MKSRITKLIMVATIVALVLVAGNTVAWAQNDGPPTVTGATGPVILDLAGKPIPSGGNGSYQQYTAEFTATGSSVTVTFAFRDDAADISFANATVTDLTTPGGNLLLNGNFSGDTVGSIPPAPWNYLIGTAQAYGGVVASGSDCGGGYCWFDGSLQGYDTISQTITTNPGDNYEISFFVGENSACKTGNGTAISPCNFSDQSNNGDTTDDGGDGIDVVVYASGATLPTSQTLTLTLLYPGTGQVTDNTGAMICSEAGGIVEQTISGTPTVQTTATCTANYPYGTSVTLYEAPNEPSSSNPASTFAGWGGACPGSAKGANECTLTMDSLQDATAGFAIPGQIVTLPVAPGQSQTYGFNQGSGQTPYDLTVLNNNTNTTFGVTVNPISISQSDCNVIIDPSFPGSNCFVYQQGSTAAMPPDSAVMFEITCPSAPDGTCGSAAVQNFLATLGSDFTFSVLAPNANPPVNFTQENPPLFLDGSAGPIYGPLQASTPNPNDPIPNDPNPYVGFLKGAGPDPLHPCTPYSAATNPGATSAQLTALNAAMFSNQIVAFVLSDTKSSPATGNPNGTGSCWIVTYLTGGEVPTVSVTQPTNNCTYRQGRSDSTTQANYTCNAVNAGSSSPTGPYLTVASCSANDAPGGSVAEGAQFDTGTIGPHTFTATVVDSATNTASSTVTYYVLGSQTITFTTPQSAAYGSSFNVASTGGGSGNLVTFSSGGSCSGGGSDSATITMTSGTGTCSVTANQAGTSDYYSAATPVTQIVNATLATPTVTFTGAPASAVYGASFPVATTTNASTTAVISASGACSNTGTTVNMTSGTGTCSLLATWAADSNYSGTTANQSTAATLKTPTVTFTGAPASAVYGASFPVATTTNASTTAAISASGACSGSGSGTANITMTSGTGTCSLLATWAADSNYSGTTANQSTTAMLASQTITFTTKAPASAANGSTFPVAATATSGLTVTIAGSGSCSGSGSGSATITMTSSTGTCTVTAGQGGNGNYQAATPVTESVTATAPPALTISPASWNIASPLYVGQRATQTFTVTNPGTTSITISSITIPGNNVENPQPPGDPDDYQITGNTCGKTLAGGANCTVKVTFIADSDDPPLPSPGNYANLTITDNASGSPQTAYMSVRVINPKVSLSSSSVSFGKQTHGTTSTAMKVTLTNSGTGVIPLTFGTISVTAGSADFELTSGSGTNCVNGGTVAAGASCAIYVTFTPPAKGTTYSGTVTITDNAQNSPQSISLSGTGN